MSLKDLFNKLFKKDADLTDGATDISSDEGASLSDEIENFMDSTWSFDELERIAKF